MNDRNIAQKSKYKAVLFLQLLLKMTASQIYSFDRHHSLVNWIPLSYNPPKWATLISGIIIYKPYLSKHIYHDVRKTSFNVGKNKFSVNVQRYCTPHLCITLLLAKCQENTSSMLKCNDTKIKNTNAKKYQKNIFKYLVYFHRQIGYMHIRTHKIFISKKHILYIPKNLKIHVYRAT